MGIVLRFHARASSRGYKSGRKSCRETPVSFSTVSTRYGGHDPFLTHCDTAWYVTPTSRAKDAALPEIAIARVKACLRVIDGYKSIALDKSQASLPCWPKESVYNVQMTLGERIKAARKRLDPPMTQQELAAEFGINYQAVSQWERNESIPDNSKLPALRQKLRITFAWLLAGNGPPPNPNDSGVLLDDMMVESFEKQAATSRPEMPISKKSRHRA